MSREIDSGAMVRSGFGLGASVDWVDVFVSPCHYFSQNRADESNWYAMGAESNYPWFERVRFRVQQLAQANSSTESTEIESLSAVRKTLSDAPEMKALQDQMADDELVVHTSTHRQFVRVHLVSKRDFWTWNWLIEQSELQEKIQDLRALADFIIRGNNRISVAQFMGSQNTTGIPLTLPGGDPSLIIVPPVEQWRSEYVFLTPNKYAFDFVQIVARPSASA